MPKSTSKPHQHVDCSFYAHKKSFFESKEAKNSNNVLKLRDNMWPTIFENQQIIQQELNDLSAVLDSEEVTKNTEQFFYFSVYCCFLLENYHAACGNYYQKKNYEQKRDQLLQKLKKTVDSSDEKKEKEFLDTLSQTFSETWNDLKENLTNPGKFSSNAGFINLSRLMLILSRLSLSQLFILFEENNILQKLAKLLNRDITAAQLIKRMSMFNGIFNALSVAVFGTRLLRNIGATFYFTFFPSKEAKKALPRTLSRLYHQVYQRKGALLNDSVWVVVNGVTNYQLFGLSAFASVGITAGFCFFDVCVLLYLKHCDEKIYNEKQRQYHKERNDLMETLKNKSIKDDEKEAILKRLEILDKQILYSQINWRQTSATYDFQTMAVLMLGVGFGFSILVCSPVVVTACYVSCLLSVAMILSGGDYGKLQAIKANRDNAKALSLDGQELDAQYQKEQLSLAFNLIKNTVGPAILIGTYLVCWEAALCLVVAYAIVEGIKHYKKHKEEVDEQPKEILATV